MCIIGSCSCSDCPVKCPTPSDLPKDVPWVKSIDGMYYVMAIAYFGAITSKFFIIQNFLFIKSLVKYN